METDVTLFTQLKNKCNEIVAMLIKIRKEAGLTQNDMAELCNVSRKKISEFENGCFDFEVMTIYAEKLSVKIEINYVVY